METPVMTGAHSRLAPSSSPIWVPCPGSVVMMEQFPDNGDNEDARDGELCHEVGGAMLTQTPRDNGGVSRDILDSATLYYHMVSKTCGIHQPKVEERVAIPAVHPECFGTMDSRWFNSARDILHIWDLKYGWGIVEPFQNWQLILYALGLLENIQATHVHLHIAQPRAPHPQGPLRTWETTALELQQMGVVAKASAHEALGDEPARLLSGQHCRYCSALLDCPVATEARLNAIDVTGRSAIIPAPTPERVAMQLTMLRRAHEVIKHGLTAVEEVATAMDKKGVVIPGWGREFTAGRIKWDNTKHDQVRAMAEMYNVDVDKPGLITPTQAMALGLPEDVVSEYSSRSSGKPKLVPINQDKIKQLLK